MEILDEGIKVYQELRTRVLDRIEQDKARHDLTRVMAERAELVDHSRETTELHFYNLALIASNELKVSHLLNIGLVEIIGQLVRVYPREVQEEIQAELGQLKTNIKEIPF